MNNFPYSPVPFLVLLMLLVQIGWYVSVIVFLYKIWQKVKHLPAV